MLPFPPSSPSNALFKDGKLAMMLTSPYRRLCRSYRKSQAGGSLLIKGDNGTHLTGIRSTGTPHLGNILGALKPAIELANDPANDSFLFIADLHPCPNQGRRNARKTHTLLPRLGLPLADTSKCFLSPE